MAAVHAAQQVQYAMFIRLSDFTMCISVTQARAPLQPTDPELAVPGWLLAPNSASQFRNFGGDLAILRKVQ